MHLEQKVCVCYFLQRHRQQGCVYYKVYVFEQVDRLAVSGSTIWKYTASIISGAFSTILISLKINNCSSATKLVNI